MKTLSLTPQPYIYLLEPADSPQPVKVILEIDVVQVSSQLLLHERLLDDPKAESTIKLTATLLTTSAKQLAQIAIQLHSQSHLSEKLRALLIEELETKLSAIKELGVNTSTTTLDVDDGLQNLTAQELVTLLRIFLPYLHKEWNTTYFIQHELLRKYVPPNDCACKLSQLSVESLVFVLQNYVCTVENYLELFSMLKKELLRSDTNNKCLLFNLNGTLILTIISLLSIKNMADATELFQLFEKEMKINHYCINFQEISPFCLSCIILFFDQSICKAPELLKSAQAELIRKTEDQHCKLQNVPGYLAVDILLSFVRTQRISAYVLEVFEFTFLQKSSLEHLSGQELVRTLYAFVSHNANHSSRENEKLIASLQNELLSKVNDGTLDTRSKLDEVLKTNEEERVLVCQIIYFLSRHNMLNQKLFNEIVAFYDHDVSSLAAMGVESLAKLTIAFSLHKKGTKDFYTLAYEATSASFFLTDVTLNTTLIAEIIIAFTLSGFVHSLDLRNLKNSLLNNTQALLSDSWLTSLHFAELMALIRFLKEEKLLTPHLLDSLENTLIQHSNKLFENRQDSLSFLLENKLSHFIVHLIDKGMDIQTSFADQSSPLHKAVEDNDSIVVKKMIEKQVPLNAFNSDGRTALHIACFLGHKETAALLIEQGASITSFSKNELRTPFQLGLASPLWQTNPAKMIHFFTHFFSPCGAVVDALDLHLNAFPRFFTEHPEYLLDKNRNERDANPLEVAYLLQNETLAFYLAANMNDSEQLTAIDALILKYQRAPMLILSVLYLKACQNKSEQHAIRLVDRMNELNFIYDDIENSQRTALHLATFTQMTQLVAHLLAKGIDLNAQDARGNTALHYACEFAFGPIALTLLNHGADPSITNKEHKVAFQVALTTSVWKLSSQRMIDFFSVIFQDFPAVVEHVKREKKSIHILQHFILYPEKLLQMVRPANPLEFPFLFQDAKLAHALSLKMPNKEFQEAFSRLKNKFLKTACNLGAFYTSGLNKTDLLKPPLFNHTKPDVGHFDFINLSLLDNDTVPHSFIEIYDTKNRLLQKTIEKKFYSS